MVSYSLSTKLEQVCFSEQPAVEANTHFLANISLILDCLLFSFGDLIVFCQKYCQMKQTNKQTINKIDY